MNSLVTIAQAGALIAEGRSLALAGSPRALASLPKGNWIAGTTHYFIGPDGGTHSNDLVFVTDLSQAGSVELAAYDASEVERIAADTPESGFSVAVIPAASETLIRFAQRPYRRELFLKPVVGWIAGIDLDAPAPAPAAVFEGRTLTRHTDKAVVAHVRLPRQKLARISIINPFEPRPDPVIRFPRSGFSAADCTVNGAPRRLADFLAEQSYTDGKLPLVGDFSGAGVNVSIRSIDRATGGVEFYAPVFAHVDYRLAEPVQDFATTFAEKIASRDAAKVAFSCNCILNYLHGNLAGKRTGPLSGPVTFGEIGYQLLNQTLVVLEVV